MNVTEDLDTLTPGELASNGMFVQGLQKLLMGGETNREVLVRSIKDMQVNGSWRAFMRNDKVYRWNAKQFREFIEADRPAGCQSSVSHLEHELRGTDAWIPYCLLIGGEPGGQPGNTNAAADKTNSDNITIGNPLMRSASSPRGTSVSSAVRRLHRERPDLLGRVESGELSAHAAMIEAGFRDKAITIPADPRKAARRLARHFTREQFSELVDEMLRCYEANGEVP